MSRTMSFNGTSCEDMGLKLLRDSVVWTPAPHKGGYIDVPGGSEPVNFSEFVSGHAEYAVGGGGENASFLVDPVLKGLADTLVNRGAVIRAVKRALHGKTVELSDSYHPEYTVEAVCSVDVDEQRELSVLNVTWERDPIRMMEPGSAEVDPVWAQGEFDPEKNVMLQMEPIPGRWINAGDGRVLNAYVPYEGDGRGFYLSSPIRWPKQAEELTIWYEIRFTDGGDELSEADYEVLREHSDTGALLVKVADSPEEAWSRAPQATIVTVNGDGYEFCLTSKPTPSDSLQAGLDAAYYRAFTFDLHKCGWDYAEVKEKPVHPSGYLTSDDLVCAYGLRSYSYGSLAGEIWQVDTVRVEYMLFKVSDVSSGNFTAKYNILTINVPGARESEDVIMTVLGHATGAKHYFYVCSTTGLPVEQRRTWDEARRAGWPDAKSRDFPDAGNPDKELSGNPEYILSTSYSDYTIRSIYYERSLGDEIAEYVEPLYEPTTEYGNPYFDYSGYYRWVEPGEDPFPGSFHGMNEVPDPWLLEEEPSWYADSDITGYSWPYAMVGEEPESYATGTAGQTLRIVFDTGMVRSGEEYDWYYYYDYVAGTVGEDGRLRYTSADIATHKVWYDQDYHEGLYHDQLYAGVTQEMADAEFDAEVPADETISSTEEGRVFAFGGDYDYSGLYTWDPSIPGMRQPASGDAWRLGQVFTDRVASDDGASYGLVPLTPVPQEFADLFGQTGSEVGFAPGLLTAADRWEGHRIYTASEEPLAVPSAIEPTYTPGVFRATYPDYKEDVSEDVDTGYPFCIVATTTHPATVSKDGMSCPLSGGVLQTDLPMGPGENAVHVNVPFSEVDDGEGKPLAPHMTLSWKRGDV